MASPFLPAMKAEAAALINEWGKACSIKRFIATLDGQGRRSGSFVEQESAEILWIQPAGGNSEIAELGIDEETTHLAFQDFDGFQMDAKDRVLPSGETYEYDVIKVHRYETQLVTELKQVKRD